MPFKTPGSHSLRTRFFQDWGTCFDGIHRPKHLRWVEEVGEQFCHPGVGGEPKWPVFRDAGSSSKHQFSGTMLVFKDGTCIDCINCWWFLFIKSIKSWLYWWTNLRFSKWMHTLSNASHWCTLLQPRNFVLFFPSLQLDANFLPCYEEFCITTWRCHVASQLDLIQKPIAAIQMATDRFCHMASSDQLASSDPSGSISNEGISAGSRVGIKKDSIGRDMSLSKLQKISAQKDLEHGLHVIGKFELLGFESSFNSTPWINKPPLKIHSPLLLVPAPSWRCPGRGWSGIQFDMYQYYSIGFGISTTALVFFFPGEPIYSILLYS